MKQGTLSFSVQRTNSVADGKSQKKAVVTGRGKKKRLGTSTEVQTNSRMSEVLEISDDEDDITAEIILPAKRTRASTRACLSPARTEGATPQPSRSEKKAIPVGIDKEQLDVQDKAGHYRKYYNEVRSRMGYMKPIHSEGQNKIHQMLRLFDMSYEFGPCIGMTRLERWERAEALGLNPPVEVRNILLTKEGPEYGQCVLHGEV